MFFRKSIAFKTFMFTTIIITIVVFVSFGTLYIVMPEYYLKQKVKNFSVNTKTLYNQLENEGDIDNIKRMIQDFSKDNNAEVYCFDNDDNLLILLYNPVPEFNYDVESTPAETYIISIAEEAQGESAEKDESDSEDTRIAVGLNEYETEEYGQYISDEFKIFIYNEEEMTREDNADFLKISKKPIDDTEDYVVLFDASAIYGVPSEPVMVTEMEENIPIEISNISSMSAMSTRSVNIANSALSSDLRFSDHEVLSSVIITSNLQPVDEAKGVLISLIPYLLGLNMFIGLISAFVYSRKFAMPIVEISNAAMQMQSLDSDIESGIRTNDELGQLSENLDLLYKKLMNNITMLTDEMEKVQKLEKSKTDFMQAASHELKTPLAGLKGMIEGMSDGVGKFKDRDKYLEEAGKLTDKMTALVYEILNASKVDSNLALNLETVDAGALLRETAENYNMFVSEKKIDLDFVLPNEPAIIETDRFVLNTVLSNIFSNAVKYTEVGGKIQAGILCGGNNTILFVENLCDSRNIDINKLFEPFYTGSYSRDRSQSGTGLGLYIVRKNLEALNLDYEFIATQTGLRFQIFLQ